MPALFPDTRTLTSLLTATAITVVAFWTIHVDLEMLRDKRWLALFAATLGGAVGIAYDGRTAIPPVPMYVAHGAVGPDRSWPTVASAWRSTISTPRSSTS